MGGQSDGKSSLLEALLGFKFNVRETEMGTRRPLLVQMSHDPSALEPQISFQDEDAETFGPAMTSHAAVAELIRERTQTHLRRLGGKTVSAKPIVMRAQFAYCPNLTIIDTPGFILKARQSDDPDSPEDIRSMVRELIAPPNRTILFLQQSSVEWCNSMFLSLVQEVDPSLQRTVLVTSKFDNRLKEFHQRWEVDRYLTAAGYLPEGTRPFFVALPKDRAPSPAPSNGSATSSCASAGAAAFRKAVADVDDEILRQLREDVEGGFDEAAHGDRVGFHRLKAHLELELQRQYRDAVPAVLALLDERRAAAAAAAEEAAARLEASGDVAGLRREAMEWTAAVLRHAGEILEGATEPDPATHGLTSVEERAGSGLGSWPGVGTAVCAPYDGLRLHGGAAFERCVAEFQAAATALSFPPASREKVANVLLARGGMKHQGGDTGASAAVAEHIARQAARQALAPLLDRACDRLAFCLRNLFHLAVERHRAACAAAAAAAASRAGGIDAEVASAPPSHVFHGALRRAHEHFVAGVTAECKRSLASHLATATSMFAFSAPPPGAHTAGGGLCAPSALSPETAERLNRLTEPAEGSDAGEDEEDIMCTAGVPGGMAGADIENCPPPKNRAVRTPGVIMGMSQVVPETPSPELKQTKQVMQQAAGRRRTRLSVAAAAAAAEPEGKRAKRGGAAPALAVGGAAYDYVSASAERLFDAIRCHLVMDVAPTAFRAGFLTPCRDRMSTAVSLELFARKDEDFLEFFAGEDMKARLEADYKAMHDKAEQLGRSAAEFRSIVDVL